MRRWAVLVSLVPGALLGCSSRLATTEGPFRDLAQPGPCVIDGAGKVLCWAGGARRQVDVAHAKRLESAGHLVCATLESGELTCWTKSTGTDGPHFDPVSLSKLQAPVHVSSDTDRHCAIRGDGTIACWSIEVPEPQVVAGIRAAQQVEVFAENACAVLASGRVVCWTITNNDPASTAAPPREVAGLTDVRQIALGFLFGCAVLHSGQVSCWGRGNMGTLGRTVEPFVEHAPAPIPGLARVAQVVAGTHTACARSVDGVVWCWGRNMACELGIKKRKVGDLSDDPLVVAGIEPSQKLSFRGRVVCSLSKAGNLTCWGGCLEGNDPNVRLER